MKHKGDYIIIGWLLVGTGCLLCAIVKMIMVDRRLPVDNIPRFSELGLLAIVAVLMLALTMPRGEG